MKASRTASILTVLLLSIPGSLRADGIVRPGEGREVSSHLLLKDITYRTNGQEVLPLGQIIMVEFQFIAARDHLIEVRPFTDGEATPDGTLAAIRIDRPEGFAAVPVTVKSGHATVTGLEFTVLEQSKQEVDRFTLRFNKPILFGDYSPRFINLRFKKPFTACMAVWDMVDVEVDYRAPERVEISALPMTDGQFSPGAMANGVNGFAGFGTLALQYGIGGSPAVVDAILLRMTSLATDKVVKETEISIDHHFGDCEPELSNVSLVQSSPACVPPGWSVQARFDYRSVRRCRVVAVPTLGGVTVEGAESLPVQLEPVTGSGEATFTFSRDRIRSLGPAQVDGVRLELSAASTGELLDTVEIPSEYRFADQCYTIEDVRVPTRPSCRPLGDEVTVEVDYWAAGPVRIELIPNVGRDPVKKSITTTDVLPGGAGTAGASFAIHSMVEIDSVLVRVWDAGRNEVLASKMERVSLQFPCDGRPEPPPHREPTFRRGDVDGSGDLDISDAIANLGFQFLGAFEISCMDAADVDDSGTLDISDPLLELSFLFLGGAEIPAPGPYQCGVDPTLDSRQAGAQLDCEDYASCN